ncbi:hypothetical protein VPH35_011892 [Triticum aestivum]|uniref:Uncharacterized protein n=1 Tax=Triticum turgidum subsp. durum TaxID=4567 RepID=A0A9R0R6D8_TRITD|nr:unnamed protein product [Triticum turgidum subsp. durum]
MNFLFTGSSLYLVSTHLAVSFPDYVFLSLIIPFLRLGEIVTGGEHFPLTSDAFKMVLTGHASKDVLLSIFHAILGWIVAAPFVMAGLYTLSVPCFKYLVGRFGVIPSSPRTPMKAVLLCPNESESESENGAVPLLVHAD